MTITQRRTPLSNGRGSAALGHAAGLLACAAALLAGAAAHAQPADLVLLGGKVVTVDARDTVARA
ncbi:MAG TPA: hypothetical protein VFO94_19085, partial [Gammaproteobacteria bacterium]|nr:hypothetical protein [Gammaproteobacteria bacterium]